MTNSFEVLVDRLDAKGGIAWLRLGKGRLAALPWPGLRKGARLRVSVSPNDIVLCAEHPGPCSARNVLAARVKTLRLVKEGALVLLDCGFDLVTRVSRRAVTELDLRRGAHLFALVKAAAVLPDRALRAAYRVSLAGKNGLLGPETVDFLGCVERGGSLALAAADLGIHYRTAWMKARAANRVWGAPLVARSSGGSGGGGSSLTPEGRAVLALAKKLEGEAA
ncbi:MAG TPA: TOBE domain-containing protein [bacterium]|jgi:molybdate transport system regulatory protein|nr:TOBE domain-containing protein [bacterium]